MRRATIATMSWSELKLKAELRCHCTGGSGPSPGASDTSDPFGMSKCPTPMSSATMNSANAGTAIRTPTVAMILEASLARLSRRKTKRSKARPSSGASTKMTTIPAHTFGQPKPFCSSK